MRAGTAESADQAFAKLKECAADDPYELVIVDLIMPDTDGLHFGKKVREIDVLQNTKLILVTAFDKPGIGEEAISLGFDAYLTKPIRQSELLDAITSILRESKDAQAPRAKAIEPRPGASRPPLHRRNDLILVAEDHPINQEVAFLLLHELGFEAHMAANGEEVLALLKRAPYAAIFMDCQMPVLDGFDATRAIRKSELRTGKHIPIIAMTAHAIEGSREQCLASGMDDYISKPISMQQLQVAIEKWLPAELETDDSQSQPNKVSNWLKLLHQKYGKSGSARLLSLLWEEVPKQIKQLEAAITIADLGNLLMVAHGLKGSCQSVFARDMDALCAKIETAALNEDWEEAAKLVSSLREEFEQMHREFLELS